MYRVNQQPPPTGYDSNPPSCVPSGYAPAPSRPIPPSQQRYPYGGSGGQAPGPPSSMPPQQLHHNGMVSSAEGMNGNCMSSNGQGGAGAPSPMAANPSRYGHPQWQQFARNGVPPPQPPPGLPPRAVPTIEIEPLGMGDLSSMRQWPSSMPLNNGGIKRVGPYGAHMDEGSALSSRQSSIEDISSRTASEDTMMSSGTGCSSASGGAGGSNALSVLAADVATRKRVRLTSEERIQRSRERNRVHARKTRKRKKVQMESIQCMIENLQEEARRMRLAVMEWYTANILLVMRSPEDAGNASDKNLLNKYMKVQAFLERSQQKKESDCNGGGSDDSGSTKDDPDGRTSSESTQGDEDDGQNGQLTALVPAAQHPWNKGTTRTRCKYAPEDRERIRRERNRIHAKRTRDRRKKFMEDSEKVLATLATENKDLRELLCMIYDHNPDNGGQQQDGGVQHGISTSANGGMHQGGEDKLTGQSHGSAYYPQQQARQGGSPSQMALSMQQRSGGHALPRPLLASAQAHQQYSRGAPAHYGRMMKTEEYDDEDDDEEEEGTESEEDDYEGEDDEDDDGRPYRRQKRSSHGGHYGKGQEGECMQEEARFYSPNGRGAVRG